MKLIVIIFRSFATAIQPAMHAETRFRYVFLIYATFLQLNYTLLFSLRFPAYTGAII